MTAPSAIPAPARIRLHSYLGDYQGCGHIRVIWPYILLNLLRDRRRYAFEAVYSAAFINDPAYYKRFTLVQFQRSATKEHLALFNHFCTNIRSKHRIPLVYEIDDALIDIPEWNYAWSYYKNNIDNIKQIFSKVDGMIVSTEPLRQLYSPYNPNIKIIPNHLAKFLWGDIIVKNNHRELKDKPRIGWAGSENHFIKKGTKEYNDGIRGGDFGTGLLDFIRKTTDKYTWVFNGALPIELSDIKDKIEFHPFVSIINYPMHLRKLDLDICIAPLMKCGFNECKSGIKILEYSLIGCPGVYSNVYPYKDMSCVSDDDEGMISYIEKLAGDVGYRLEVWNKDYEVVRDDLYWEDNDNLLKYVNTYLSLFNRKLAD